MHWHFRSMTSTWLLMRSMSSDIDFARSSVLNGPVEFGHIEVKNILNRNKRKPDIREIFRLLIVEPSLLYRTSSHYCVCTWFSGVYSRICIAVFSRRNRRRTTNECPDVRVACRRLLLERDHLCCHKLRNSERLHRTRQRQIVRGFGHCNAMQCNANHNEYVRLVY